MAVTYRHATVDDIPAIEAFRQTVPGAEAFVDHASGYQYIGQEPNSWVAEENGQIVGYMICARFPEDSPNEIRIYCVLTQPNRMYNVGVALPDCMIGEMQVGESIRAVLDPKTP